MVVIHSTVVGRFLHYMFIFYSFMISVSFPKVFYAIIASVDLLKRILWSQNVVVGTLAIQTSASFGHRRYLEYPVDS